MRLDERRDAMLRGCRLPTSAAVGGFRYSTWSERVSMRNF